MKIIAISASGQFRQTLPHVLANAGRETTVLLRNDQASSLASSAP